MSLESWTGTKEGLQYYKKYRNNTHFFFSFLQLNVKFQETYLAILSACARSH
jgi:hypothetical protein